MQTGDKASKAKARRDAMDDEAGSDDDAFGDDVDGEEGVCARIRLCVTFATARREMEEIPCVLLES